MFNIIRNYQTFGTLKMFHFLLSYIICDVKLRCHSVVILSYLIYLFSSGCFKIFPLFFHFQQFDCDAPRYHLYLYLCCLVLAIPFGPVLHYFSSNLGNFWSVFFQKSFSAAISLFLLRPQLHALRIFDIVSDSSYSVDFSSIFVLPVLHIG